MSNDTLMLLALGVGAYFLLKGQGGRSQQQQPQLPQPAPANFWDFAGQTVTTIGNNLGSWLSS